MMLKIWGILVILFAGFVAYQAIEGDLFDDAGNPSTKSAQNSKPTGDQKNEGMTISDEAPPEPTRAEIEAAAEEAKLALEYEPKTDQEIYESVGQICDEMTQELKEAKIGSAFARVKTRFHENRLKTPLLTSLINSCFRQSTLAENSLEIEVFSSEFGGQAGDQIQLQVSVFDKAYKNKHFEVGRPFEVTKIVMPLHESAAPNSSGE